MANRTFMDPDSYDETEISERALGDAKHAQRTVQLPDSLLEPTASKRNT